MKNLKATKMKKEIVLQNSQTASEVKIQISSIKQSIVLASERTEKELPTSIDNTANDVVNEFKHLSIEQIQLAIKKGALGYAGETYGRLSTQTICIWIRTEHPEKPFVYKY